MSGDAGTPPPADGGGLAGKATASVAWTMTQAWVIRVTGFVTIAILTRLLSPADFGVVAVALSILPFIQLFSEFGFTAYLTQAERASSRALSTAFWYSVPAATVFAAVVFFAAPGVSTLMGAPEAAPVIRALTVVPPLTVLGLIPVVVLRRAMRFRVLAMQGVIASAIGQALAIGMAIAGTGVWALVAQTIIVQLLGTIMSWITSKWTPTREFSRSEFGTMIRFGTKVIGSDAVAVVRVWAENLIVVSFLGTTGLGYLSVAQRLVTIAHELTTNAVAPVSLVIFSQIRESIDRLRSGYLRAQYLAHTLVVPVMLVIAVAGPQLYLLLFGSQWEPSVLPGQILAVAGIFGLSGMDKGLLLGMGRPGVWLAYVFAVDAVTVALAFFTAQHGLVPFALGFLAVAMLATVARWAIIARPLSTSWWQISQPVRLVAIPALAASAVGIGVNLLVRDMHPLVTLMLTGLAILVVYVPFVRLMLPSVWHEVWTLAAKLFRRLARKPRRETQES